MHHVRLAKTGWPDLLIVATAMLVATPHALFGQGYVLDDWYALANAHLDGAWSAAGSDQWKARPGAGLVYAVTFGAAGNAPGLAYAVLAAIAAVTAVVLFRLGLRLWSRPVALVIAVMWLALPNHTSLWYWPSAANIAVALLLLLIGLRLVLGCESNFRLGAAGILLGAATLSYEAVGPTAVVGSLWLARRSECRMAMLVPFVGIPLALASAWMVFFWHPAKRGLDQTADLALAFPAHFGWGVVPGGLPAYVAGLIAAAGIVIVGVRSVDPRRRPGRLAGEHLVTLGLASIALGTVPFIRYFYEPLGAGDRVNVVASLGTALFWAGLIWIAAELLPRAAVAAAVIVMMMAFGISQVEAARAWTEAERHAASEVKRIGRSDCREPITLERGPTRRNVMAFLDRSNVAGAASVACDRRVADVRLAP